MSAQEIKVQFVDLHRDFLNVQNENKRLREALKHYADKSFWEKFHDKNYGITTRADFDYGNIAVMALEGDF